MTKFADALYSRFKTFKTAVSLFMIIIYCAAVHLAGGSVIRLGLFWLVCRFYIFLPGAVICKAVGLERFDGDENSYFSLYFLIGTGLLMAVFLPCAYFNFWIPLQVFSPMVGLAGLFFSKYYVFSDVKRDGRKLDSQTLFMLMVFAFLLFIYAFLGVAKHAHPSKVGQIILSQDFMWTVGNAESFKISFPPQDIRFSGVQLKYHYLTEMISCAVSVISGISNYDIIGFYLQGFMALFLITALYDFARVYFGKNTFKINMFLVSFFALSCLSLWKALPGGASVFGNSLLEALVGNANSMTGAFAFLAVFAMLVVGLTRRSFGFNPWRIAAAAAAFLMLSFSKSPIAAIAAIAIAMAALINLFTRNEKIMPVLMALAACGVFGAVYVLIMRFGAGRSTSFSLTGTLKLGYFRNFLRLFSNTNIWLYRLSIPVFMVLQTVCIAPFQSVVVLPKMLSDAFKITRLSFEKLWFYACIAGGILGFFLTEHEAFSQVYFVYTAIFFLNLLAVDYFPFDRIKPKNIIAYGLLVLSCATAVFMYTNFGGSGIRQFLFHYNVLEKYDYPFVVKAEDEAAGMYLRENMQAGELFITNRTHTGAGEGLSNVYTCFSGRPSYMEGFKYTVSNMGVEWRQVDRRLQLVGKVFGIYDQQAASLDEIIRLCKNHNIRYVVYSSQFEGDISAFSGLEPVFSDNSAVIYKIY